MNALGLEDLKVLNEEFGYEFIIESGRIIGFTMNEM